MAYGLIALMLLMLSSTPLPASPSNQTNQTSAPPPCSLAELQQSLDLMSQSVNLFFESTLGLPFNPQRADERIEIVLAYEDALNQYYSDIYPQMPACSDGLMLREAGGLAYEQIHLANILFALADWDYVGEQDRIWSALFNVSGHDRYQAAVSGVNQLSVNLITLSETGRSLYAGAFAPCTAEDRAEIGWLDEWLADYAALFPDLRAYLDGADPTPLTFYLTEVIASALVDWVGAPLCAEALHWLHQDNHLYMTTSITLHLKALSQAATESNHPLAPDLAHRLALRTEALQSLWRAYLN